MVATKRVAHNPQLIDALIHNARDRSLQGMRMLTARRINTLAVAGILGLIGRMSGNTDKSGGRRYMNEQRVLIIEKWMLSIIEEDGISRYRDLHIHFIDDEWKPRYRWVDGGLEAYRVAFGLRELHKFPFTLALRFVLEESDQLRGVDFKTLDELGARLDWTQPSLYLFEPGREPWVCFERARPRSLTHTRA